MSADTAQAMRPSGLVGRLFGAVMERMNAHTYRWTLNHLRPTNPQSLYEIGFGTGRLLELAARSLHVRRLYGVDPSDLMVETAATRLRKFERKIDIDLRAADDSASFWPDQTFDAIVALHSFQFWPVPAKTLAALRRQLSPSGTLTIVLRRHGRRPPQWLPNPISRSSDEIAGTISALKEAGFLVVVSASIDKASHGIVAKPAA